MPFYNWSQPNGNTGSSLQGQNQAVQQFGQQPNQQMQSQQMPSMSQYSQQLNGQYGQPPLQPPAQPVPAQTRMTMANQQQNPLLQQPAAQPTPQPTLPPAVLQGSQPGQQTQALTGPAAAQPPSAAGDPNEYARRYGYKSQDEMNNALSTANQWYTGKFGQNAELPNTDMGKLNFYNNRNSDSMQQTYGKADQPMVTQDAANAWLKSTYGFVPTSAGMTQDARNIPKMPDGTPVSQQILDYNNAQLYGPDQNIIKTRATMQANPQQYNQQQLSMYGLG